ncbi:hypothetical protein, partial [Massilia horti]
MRISIGLRLFAAVLLALLAVAAGALFLLRQNVLASFGEYAVGIELDRLDELSGDLARKYRAHGGWKFVPAGSARRSWVARELTRLQTLRDEGALDVTVLPPPRPPKPPAAARASLSANGALPTG